MTLNSNHLIRLNLISFAESDYGVSVGEGGIATQGCIVIPTLISLSVFPQRVRLNISMFMFLPILSVPLFHYLSITSNLLFCSLNINKVSKQHRRVSSISFSQKGAWIKQPVYVCIGQRFD